MVAAFKHVIFVLLDLLNPTMHKVRELKETSYNTVRDVLLFPLNQSMLINSTRLALDGILSLQRGS